jgi:signal transduction histidine kinase
MLAPMFMQHIFASVCEFKEVIVLKRRMWSTLLLGLWLMLFPFVLTFLNQVVFNVLWEDLILGFGIATFSLCRLFARRSEEITMADWIVTGAGLLTFVNPFLYSYYNVTVAAWNNVIIGGVVFLLAAYQDWKDSDAPPVKQRHHKANS